MRENTDTYVRFDLIPNQDKLQPLVAEFYLLDDEGSIAMNITTEEDYINRTLFRPPTPDFYDLDYFEQNPPKKNLFDFLQQEFDNEFGYRILNDKGEAVYWSDPLRLLV